VQRKILTGMLDSPITGSSILDIGCGAGVIHLELLRRGAGYAIGIDIAQGMIEQAQTLAQLNGFEDRTRYIHGDFVDRSNEIAKADISILDKVVCCYEDLDSLLNRTIDKTKSVIVISHPRNTTFVRMGFIIQQIFTSIFRLKFQPVWHDWQIIHMKLAHQGYTKVFHNFTFLWDIVIYSKKNG